MTRCRSSRRSRRAWLAVAVFVALVAAARLPSHANPPAAPDPTAPATETTAPAGASAQLAALQINDAPAPDGFRRDDWPHWLDLDGDHCDTRERALLDSSEIPAGVAPNCEVTAGRWTSAYDGLVITDPARIDLDHVVPLAVAYRSGGNLWSTEQRARFANDPANLWPVSASSNRSKGDSAPPEWQPPRHEVWCTYASRWTTIKVTYGLTATIRERDALGSMLDTCTGGTP